MSRLGSLRNKVVARLTGRRRAPDPVEPPKDLVLASTALFPTAKGSQYLQQICKHFAHKMPVSFDEAAGSITLYAGLAHFTADDSGLDVRVEAADIRGLIENRFVIDKHLAIFAFRDKFSGFTWSDPYAPPAPPTPGLRAPTAPRSDRRSR